MKNRAPTAGRRVVTICPLIYILRFTICLPGQLTGPGRIDRGGGAGHGRPRGGRRRPTPTSKRQRTARRRVSAASWASLLSNATAATPSRRDFARFLWERGDSEAVTSLARRHAMDDLGVFTLTLPPSDDGPDDSTPDDDAPPMLRILTSDQATEDEEQADADTVLRDAADAAQQEREAWLGGWTGGNIWESSEVLARLLCLRPQSWWAGKRVVELGAGCGLVGLTALALGAAEVTLTDQVLYMAR